MARRLWLGSLAGESPLATSGARPWTPRNEFLGWVGAQSYGLASRPSLPQSAAAADFAQSEPRN